MNIFYTFGCFSFFNFLLIIFLFHFIYLKVKTFQTSVNLNSELKKVSRFEILLKTLGFTYLNAHVYSDTVFFLGNFSKNFLFEEKVYFGIGASIASFTFFYLIGYLSKYLSKYAQSKNTWRNINIFIIGFMTLLILYIIRETLYFL